MELKDALKIIRYMILGMMTMLLTIGFGMQGSHSTLGYKVDAIIACSVSATLLLLLSFRAQRLERVSAFLNGMALANVLILTLMLTISLFASA